MSETNHKRTMQFAYGIPHNIDPCRDIYSAERELGENDLFMSVVSAFFNDFGNFVCRWTQ